MKKQQLRSVHLVVGAALVASMMARCAAQEGSAPRADNAGAPQEGAPAEETAQEEEEDPNAQSRFSTGRGPWMHPAPPEPKELTRIERAAVRARLVEESDIYKLVDNHLYVLNRYRGLQIIDLSNEEAPVLVGQASIHGYPREMFIRGRTAYVIVSDYYYFWQDPGAIEAYEGMRNFHGSQLRVIDLSNPTKPTETGRFDLEGNCTDARIVGDVMYLVVNREPYDRNYTTQDTMDGTQIVSINMRDPQDIHQVQELWFPREGHEHHIHVTANTIYLAATKDWDDSTIRSIDISDDNGAIVARGSVQLPGTVIDRWAMDEHANVLRVATGPKWGNGDVHVSTISLLNPDEPSVLGRYTLHVGEALKSARFDGSRGYVVTFRQVDPLFAFDLSNPQDPKLLGELKMTGWLDFMVPMGDRIVALGRDEVEHQDGPWSWRSFNLAVSLVDVSHGKPELMSRVKLDGVSGYVPAERDDLNKVFKVFPQEGLVVFPFRIYERHSYRVRAGVQLIDLHRDSLVERGRIEDAGWVERGVLKDPSTLLTISSQVFQVLDIGNRDLPQVRSRLELARHVTDFALLDDTHTVQLSGDPELGDYKLTVTTRDDLDSANPVAQVNINAASARMFVNGSMASVVEMHELPAGFQPWFQVTPEEARTGVRVFDLSDPTHPRERGYLQLPEHVTVDPLYAGAYDSRPAMVRVGNALAIHKSAGGYGIFGCSDATGDKLYIVDLSNPDAPRLSSTLNLNRNSWGNHFMAVGNQLVFTESTYERFSERHYLRRVELSNPSDPRLSERVEIPGVFMGATSDFNTIYAQKYEYNHDISTVMSAVRLEGNRARTLSDIRINGYFIDAHVTDQGAFISTIDWDDYRGYASSSNFYAVDTSNPEALRVASTFYLQGYGSQVRAVQGERMAVGTALGVYLYKITDLGKPVLEEFFKINGFANDVVIGDEQVFVTSGYHGVQTLLLDRETR